jgi:hypothetical protein
MLEIKAKEILRLRKEAEKEVAKRRMVRKWVVAAGLRPVDRVADLTCEEYDKYCRHYDIDYERDSHEMPCNSWVVKDRHGEWGMSPVWYWYCEFKRGVMTREEYNLRVLEHAGLPVPEEPPGGRAPASDAVSACASTADCALQAAGSSSGA